MMKKLEGEDCQVRKSPRKPQGREQSQIQLPPKKRAKTNELIAGYFFYAFLILL